MRRHLINLFLLTVFLPVSAQAAGAVYMEDMTWMEIRDRIQQGATTVIIPTGGIEQAGPHMVIDKHNIVVRYTSGEIAKRLGNALVAPVVPFVPEGRINPPEGHMQFAGTISLRDETFGSLLEDIATSMKQHGFRLICFVADHGGSQKMQQQIAARLSEMWQSSGVRVINVSNYYTSNGQEKWMESVGIRIPNPGKHAGLIETSELMAADSQSVRDNLRGAYSERDYTRTGAMGDSTAATAANGRRFLSLKVEAAVEQIVHASSGSQ